MFVAYLPLLMTSIRPIECKQSYLLYTIIWGITGHSYILTTINKINMVIFGCWIFMEGRLCRYAR